MWSSATKLKQSRCHIISAMPPTMSSIQSAWTCVTHICTVQTVVHHLQLLVSEYLLAKKHLCTWTAILLLLLSFNVRFFQLKLGHNRLRSSSPVLEQNLWALIEQDFFYRWDVLPATEPSTSKHWMEHKAISLTSGLAWHFLIHNRTPDGTQGSLHLCAIFPSPTPVKSRTIQHNVKVHCKVLYIISEL